MRPHPSKTMSRRCAYKDGRRRCSRNGFGEPPLCRTHALQANLDGQEIRFDSDSPTFGWLDAVDRVLSRSNNDLAQRAATFFGEFLSASAARKPPGGPARGPVRGPQQGTPPPRPPPRAPLEDPRLILGFEPGETLTKEIVKKRKKELASLFHPDRPGGSATAMKRVNEAADRLLGSL